MTIANPVRGILTFNSILVDCSSCEYYGQISNISDHAKKDLVKATSRFRLNEERKMLLRVQELFTRHPHSKHETILYWTSRSKIRGGNVTPEPDPEYEKDLGENPDVAEYLSQNFANLENRLDFTKDSEKELRSFDNHKEIACPECGSSLVVPERLYMFMGSYLDDIGYGQIKRHTKMVIAKAKE